MDSKRMKNLAVAAGVTAVLAMSPVVGPAVTALATDGSSAQLSEVQQTYVVTYEYCGGEDADGNTGPKEVEYKANQTLNAGSKNPKVSREGYTFEGWYTDPSYTTSSKVNVMSYPVTGNVTLYAHWVTNPTITFYNAISYEDLTEVESWSDVATYGKSYAKPNNPDLPKNSDSDKYIFDGWFIDPSLEDQYKFTGWNSGFTEDTALYAKWKKFPTVTYYLSPESKRYHTVDVDLNASPDERLDSLKPSAIEAALSDTIPEGYSIEGFYTDKDYEDQVKLSDLAYVDEDTTLYIKFDKQPTVTYEFVDEDGNKLDAKSVEVLDANSVEVIVNLFDYADAQNAPAGYQIVGYYVRGSLIPDITNYEITGDTTITVECSDTATVTFNYGYEGISDTTQDVNIGETVSAPVDPEREGYKFGGWYTDEGCTEDNKYDFTTLVYGDMTLYAKWIQNEEADPETPVVETHEVIFDDCLASTDNQVFIVDHGDTINPADVKTPVCEGWNFLGWFTDPELTQEFNFTSPITDDMTVYAKWEKVTVSGSDDGTTEDPTDVTKPGDQPAADTATDKADAEEEALPKTGDASVVVSGIAALGTALAGAGVVTRRRH